VKSSVAPVENTTPKVFKRTSATNSKHWQSMSIEKSANTPNDTN
jgi:hypothetical protein